MTNAIIISVIQIFLVNSNFSNAFKFKIKVTIMAANATIPAVQQNGINLGYCFVTGGPSRDIAIAIPNKFSRHSRARLKKIAETNANVIASIIFFISPPPF